MAVHHVGASDPEDELEASPAEMISVRRFDGVCLLPGVLMLLGFELLLLRSDALGRDQGSTRIALVLSMLVLGLSVVVFASLAGLAQPRDSLVRSATQAVTLFEIGIGALAVGIAADFFILGVVSTGLTIMGELAGLLTFLLTYVPRSSCPYFHSP